MKRLATSLLGALLLVGMLAQPAAADRDLGTGSIPHSSFVYFFGVDFGLPELVQVPTGEWVTLNGGWGTATAALRDDFLAKVKVEIRRNGVPQPVTTENLFLDGEETPYAAAFPTLIRPKRANVPETWTVKWTFTADHFDGVSVTPAGTVYEGSRIIVWTPRGTFPSAAYPCPNGGYPCVDL